MGMRGTLRRSVMAVVCLGTALVVAPSANAQQGTTITGRITDAGNGQPVAAAQVNIVGTQIGAITNAVGRYTIVGAPAGQQTVRAILIGHATRCALSVVRFNQGKWRAIAVDLH